MNKKAGMNWRAMTAFIVTWAFLIVTVTGTVLYIVPQGRIANWTNWAMVGLGKEDWGHVHMMFGAIFIVFGILHLWFNWKPFKKYLAERAAGHFHVKREVVVSAAIAALVLGASVLQVPPVSWVFDLNERIKDAWAVGPGVEPPFGHAEELTLAELGQRSRLNAAQAKDLLEAAGVRLDDPDATLAEIAAANGLTPSQVYGLMAKAAPPPPVLQASGASADEVTARFRGTGIGRKTPADICAETGLDPQVAQGRLAAAGLAGAMETKLKDLATDHGIDPIDVAKVMLVEGYKP